MLFFLVSSPSPISPLTSFRLFSSMYVCALMCRNRVIVPKFSLLFRRNAVYWLINSIQFRQKMLRRKKHTLRFILKHFITFIIFLYVFCSLFSFDVKIILFHFWEFQFPWNCWYTQSKIYHRNESHKRREKLAIWIESKLNWILFNSNGV